MAPTVAFADPTSSSVPVVYNDPGSLSMTTGSHGEALLQQTPGAASWGASASGNRAEFNGNAQSISMSNTGSVGWRNGEPGLVQSVGSATWGQLLGGAGGAGTHFVPRDTAHDFLKRKIDASGFKTTCCGGCAGGKNCDGDGFLSTIGTGSGIAEGGCPHKCTTHGDCVGKKGEGKVDQCKLGFGSWGNNPDEIGAAGEMVNTISDIGTRTSVALSSVATMGAAILIGYMESKALEAVIDGFLAKVVRAMPSVWIKLCWKACEEESCWGMWDRCNCIDKESDWLPIRDRRLGRNRTSPANWFPDTNFSKKTIKEAIATQSATLAIAQQDELDEEDPCH